MEPEMMDLYAIVIVIIITILQKKNTCSFM